MKANQVTPHDHDGKSSARSVLSSAFCCCCSMNVFLPSILIFQTAVAVVAIWVMGIVSADAQITILASRLSDSEAQRLDALTHSYFQQFSFLMDTFLDDEALGYISFNRTERYQLAKNLLRRKASFPELDYLYFGFPDKGIVAISRNGPVFSVLVSNFSVPSPVPVVYYALADPITKVIDETNWRRTIPFDTTKRPWYVAAQARPHTTVWTPIFLTAGDGDLGFTVAYGFEKNGQITGVAAIESTLSNLSVQLKKLDLSANGRVFVVERHSGLLVAASHGELSNATTRARLYSNESADNYILTASEYLLAKYGGFGNIVRELNETVSTFYYLGSEKMLLQIRRMYVSEPLDWITIILTPEYDIMGSIYTMYIIMAAVVVAIIILSSAVVISLTLCVTVPLMRLGTQMTEVANMTLKEVGSSIVLVKEVVTIQRAFNAMVSKLKEYKAFLPDHILQRDFGEEELKQDINPSEAAQQAAELSGSGSGSFGSRNRSRLSVASSVQPHANLQTQIFALGVDLKEVCLLQLKILNRSDLFLKITPHEYVQLHGKVLEEVIRILARHKGSLMHFDEDSVTAIWATNTRFVNGAKSACNAALEVRKFIDNLAVEESLPIQYAISVVKGGCLCGNIGTSNKRIYTAFGEVKYQGLKIIKYCSYLKAKILVDAAIHDAASTSFEFQPIPELGFAAQVPVATKIEDFQRRVSMYHLVASKSHQKGDEWMYELQQSEAANQLALYNSGYQLYSTGDFAKAVGVLEKLLNSQSTHVTGDTHVSMAGDIPIVMHRLCHQLMQSNSDTRVVMSLTDNKIDPCFVKSDSPAASKPVAQQL